MLKDHSSAILYDDVRVPICQRLQGDPWRWRWLGKVSVTSLLLLLLIGSTFALTGCGGLSEFDEFGIL